VVVNVAFPLERVPVPSVVLLSRNVMVPVIVPEVVELTVAVIVTDWPALEGLTDELTTVDVAAPVAPVAVPVNEIPSGLPGAELVTKTCPFTGNIGKVSAPGAKETLMTQDAPGASVAPQLFVSEKFSEAWMPAMLKVVSPALVNVTAFEALVVFMAWLPKASDGGTALATGPVTPVPWSPADSVWLAAFVVSVSVPEAGPFAGALNLTESVQLPAAASGDTHVFALMEKGPATTGAAKVRGPLPLFVSVRVCAALELPETTGPKS
jgi:hypothetical protein